MLTELFKPLPRTELPVFYKIRNDDVLIYAPGFLVRVEKTDWETALSGSSEWQKLLANADKSLLQPESRHQKFTPISLNVYLTRLCNLSCQYCFSDPSKANPEYLSTSTESILEGSRLVVDNCRKMGVPMTFVLNGGGEPTLDQRIEPLVDFVKEICAQNNVPIFTYLATNGIMSAEKAKAVSSLFDLIGLSCDGPPEIQDMQRPKGGEKKSSTIVEQTAAIFRQSCQAFEVRVTLTKDSWQHMIRIANYITEKIQPQGINVELGYQKPPFPIKEEDFPNFTEGYFAAKDVCAKANIPWHSNAVRPGQQHRQYCHILQNTLQILPGDGASLCFLDNDVQESLQRGTQIAQYDPQSPKWTINEANIDQKRKILLEDQDFCANCFLASHCHRSCPDSCPLTHPRDLPDIHCKINRHLFNEYLERSGNDLAVYCQQQNVNTAGKEVYEC